MPASQWIEHHRVFNGRERVFIDHVNGELDDWRSENLELRLVTKPVCAGDFRRFWDIAV